MAIQAYMAPCDEDQTRESAIALYTDALIKPMWKGTQPSESVFTYIRAHIAPAQPPPQPEKVADVVPAVVAVVPTPAPVVPTPAPKPAPKVAAPTAFVPKTAQVAVAKAAAKAKAANI